MLNFLKTIFKKQNFVVSAKMIAPELKKRYCINSKYTIGQIRTTLADFEIPKDEWNYLYYLFLRDEDFSNIEQEIDKRMLDNIKLEVNNFLDKQNSAMGKDFYESYKGFTD
tara:strand:+ start:769 stop:1101 length:333 start_codon:yes stop_codon:yes gene_type:complete